MNIHILIVVMALSFFGMQTYAQTQLAKPLQYKYNKWSVSIHNGLMLSYADIKQYPIMPVASNNSEYKFGFGVDINRQLTTTIGLKAEALFGTLSGSKRDINTYFRSELNEFSLQTNISLNNLCCPKKEACRLKVYAMGGFGLVSFRSALRHISDNSFIFGYGYSAGGGSLSSMTTEWIIPVGLGAKFRIDDDVDLGLESSFRFMKSDKLDAFVLKGSSADKYQYTSISITYKFGNGRYQLEWLSPKQKKMIDQFLIDSVYKFSNANDTILSLYFETNEFDISLENEVNLMKAIQYLNENPSANLEIVGYYDINSEARFLNGSGNLAINRANNVAKLLNEKYNIKNSRLNKKKVGDALQYPLTTAANAKNRRVDFIVKAPKL